MTNCYSLNVDLQNKGRIRDWADFYSIYLTNVDIDIARFLFYPTFLDFSNISTLVKCCYSCVHWRLFSRYHYFQIKAPRGTPLVIQSEDDNTYDPHALACLLPREIKRIPEALREVQIFSKSQRKTNTLKDVKGQQIGRVQHFLNTQLHGLLRCGKITRIEG